MAYLIIACVGTAIVVINAIFAKMPTYHASPLFLLPLLWLPYFLRRKLHLLPLHFALFAAAILLHDLGAFGYYQRSPLPISFDIVVHFYFAFSVALLLHRALAAN